MVFSAEWKRCPKNGDLCMCTSGKNINQGYGYLYTYILVIRKYNGIIYTSLQRV